MNFPEVSNRGFAPQAFLDELVAWCKRAPVEVFAQNSRFDIYSAVREDLGPWKGLLHRRAVMCEVLRVLGGFESSWNWLEGHDIKNPKENSVLTKSAGIFQVSADSMGLDRSLRAFAYGYLATDPAEFRSVMMTNHEFAFGYTARLLRITTGHHGPVRDGFINPWLRRASVEQFISLLS